MIVAMFIVNFILSYIIMSNIMINSTANINNNLNKIYMAIFMASLMGISELGLMSDHMMLNSNDKNFYMIMMIGLAVVSAYFIRKQILINDKQFLLSMIEHHSSALLMAGEISEKTNDPDIKKLADNIVKSQTDEINLMKNLVNK